MFGCAFCLNREADLHHLFKKSMKKIPIIARKIKLNPYKMLLMAYLATPCH